QQSSGRVLERDRIPAAETELVEHEPVEVGFGLRRRDVLAARDEVEGPEEPEPRQVALNMPVARIRGQANPESVVLRLDKERDNPREYGVPLVARPVEGLSLVLERFPVSPRVELVPGVECEVGVADAAGEERPVKGDPVHLVD